MRLVLFLSFFLLLACQDKNKETSPNIETGSEASAISEENPEQETYTNEKFGLSFDYPKGYEVYEGTLPGDVPVLNVYKAEAAKPPLAIHEDNQPNYISFLPEGYGVDGPGGTRKTLQEWEEEPPFSFSVDPVNSTVYLLEDGTPWAFYLQFENPPQAWNKYGGIFVHYAVHDFKTKCFDKENRKLISSKDCDPMAGDDLKFYGKVPSEEKESLNQVLKSLNFVQNKKKQEALTDLIQVETPKEGAVISSPVTIKGRARGTWFFEGVAPVQLVSNNGELIKEGHIEAKESWMTENFVPFEGELSFELGKDELLQNEKRGYLLINRANASGKKEHDRVVRIPVVFQ